MSGASGFRPALVAPVAVTDLVEHLRAEGYAAELVGAADAQVTGIAMDSRKVIDGDLYVGVGGARHHGADYAGTAAASGARAVLTDERGAARLSADGVELSIMVVDDVRGALGAASSRIYRSDEAAELYGVTGTNGKTTTTYFLRSLLDADQHTGLIGTIEIRAGERVVPSEFTTPEAPELHGLLMSMQQDGITAVAMEVSSHSISYRRIAGLRYHVAGFTNLTQDHLDLHGSMQEYFETKAALFSPQRCDTAVITLNATDEPERWGERMAHHAVEHGTETVTLDLGPVAARPAEIDADWVLNDVIPHGLGHRFTLRHRDGTVLQASVGLPGGFNVANAALAALMVLHGHPRAEWGSVMKTLAEQPGPFDNAVPGRMEVISERPAGIVDFAHNADGLSQALKAVRGSGRTILVFGATGERDVSKRPIMGTVAARGADVVIVTDDDPHNEDPAPIRRQVLDGALTVQSEQQRTGATGVDVLEIEPRAAAIEAAVALAGADDVILVAGRGHETIQDVAGVAVALDDRVELRRALSHHGWITTPAASTTEGPDDGILNKS
ncbi:MAG: Mur ligase family protein [Micrococcaceae bacterium]